MKRVKEKQIKKRNDKSSEYPVRCEDEEKKVNKKEEEEEGKESKTSISPDLNHDRISTESILNHMLTGFSSKSEFLKKLNKMRCTFYRRGCDTPITLDAPHPRTPASDPTVLTVVMEDVPNSIVLQALVNIIHTRVPGICFTRFESKLVPQGVMQIQHFEQLLAQIPIDFDPQLLEQTPSSADPYFLQDENKCLVFKLERHNKQLLQEIPVTAETPLSNKRLENPIFPASLSSSWLETVEGKHHKLAVRKFDQKIASFGIADDLVERFQKSTQLERHRKILFREIVVETEAYLQQYESSSSSFSSSADELYSRLSPPFRHPQHEWNEHTKSQITEDLAEKMMAHSRSKMKPNAVCVFSDSIQWQPIGKQRQRFENCVPSVLYPNIPLMYLNPGESLSILMYATTQPPRSTRAHTLETDNLNARLARAYFRKIPKISLNSIPDHLKQSVLNVCGARPEEEENVFGLSSRSNDLEVWRRRECTDCGRCGVYGVEVQHSPQENNFALVIESQSALDPLQIYVRTFDLFIEEIIEYFFSEGDRSI